jgi:hypothetical protein
MTGEYSIVLYVLFFVTESLFVYVQSTSLELVPILVFVPVVELVLITEARDPVKYRTPMLTIQSTRTHPQAMKIIGFFFIRKK